MCCWLQKKLPKTTVYDSGSNVYSITSILLRYPGQKLSELIWTRSAFASAGDSAKTLPDIGDLLTLDKGDDSLQVSVASSMKGCIKYHITFHKQFDCL